VVLKGLRDSLIPFKAMEPVVVVHCFLTKALDCKAWSADCLRFDAVDVDRVVVDVRDVDVESAAQEAGTSPIVLKAGKERSIGEEGNNRGDGGNGGNGEDCGCGGSTASS
jgi:hypothetical protein